MNKYERLYTEASVGGKNPSWLDTAIRPLAADLSEATGLPARVSGPFGLRAECESTSTKTPQRAKESTSP